MGRFAAIVDVHIVFEVDGRILLGRRANTGWSDGMWHLPAGHLEPDETVVDAACREAAEEVGVRIEPADLVFAHVMQHFDDGDQGRVGFFFRATRWTGQLVNAEPEKCQEIGWFAPYALPVETVGYAAAAIGQINRKISYSEYGDLSGG